MSAEDMADINALFELDEHEQDDFNAALQAPIPDDINIESDEGADDISADGDDYN